MITLCSYCQGNVGSWNDSTTPDCVRDEPCGPCVTLASLNAKILETEALLEELKKRRNVTRTQLNRVHDHFLQQVPLEIASYIFTLDVSRTRYKSGRNQHPRPLTLASVCKSWRDIAFSTPHLWISLDIRRTGEEWDFPIHLAEQWLARSGQLPLDITLHWKHKLYFKPSVPWTLNSFVASTIQAMIELICSHSSRWNTLDMDMTRDAFPLFKVDVQTNSSLQNLRIIASNSSNEAPPFNPANIVLHPKKVEIATIPPALVHIDWANIVELEILNSITSAKALKTLKQCLRIQKLQLHIQANYQYPRAPVPTQVKPLILSHLKFLGIQSGSEESDYFFDFIEVTAICDTVQYCYDYHGQANLVPLTSLLKRSACSLARLKFECSDFTLLNEEGLTNLLYDLPTLVSLSLYSITKPLLLTDGGVIIPKEPLFSNEGTFIQQFLTDSSSSSQSNGSTSRSFLPLLKTFTYSASQGFSWNTLANIYEFHCGPRAGAQPNENSQRSQYQHPPRKLRSLKLLKPNPKGDKDLIDKESLLRFFNLPNSSMKVNLNRKLLAASIAYHHLTPDKDVSSFFGLGSSDVVDSLQS